MPTNKAVSSYPILCLGNSITVGLVNGGQVAGGYRARLQRLILQPSSPLIGRPIRFVGNFSNNNNGNDTYWPLHEGVGGERIDQMQTRIGSALSTWNPRVVFLHAGTNDIVQDFSLGSAQSRLATLVQTCLDHPSVERVYVADLINFRSTATTFNTRANTFRTGLSTALSSQIATGKCFLLTTFNNLIIDANFTVGDDVHPNKTGYDLMADQFYAGLVANPPPP